MAKGKKSVLLYCDIIHTVEELSDEEAGVLFKHYLRYINDQNPEAPDKLTKIVFEPIKQNLKRDLKKWEDIKITHSESGKKGMENRWKEHNKVKQSITNDNAVINGITNITVKDTVTDTVTVKAKDIKRERFSPPDRFDVINHFSKTLDEFTAMAESDKFIAYYESNGWKVGKNKMQSWKGAATGWITRMLDYGKSKLTTEQLRELARQQDEELLKQKQ